MPYVPPACPLPAVFVRSSKFDMEVSKDMSLNSRPTKLIFKNYGQVRTAAHAAPALRPRPPAATAYSLHRTQAKR